MNKYDSRAHTRATEVDADRVWRVSCQNNSCRFWHDLNSENNNCIINKVNDAKTDFTLEEVGKLFNITRMRVCQIEKSILSKLKKSLSF